MKDNQAKYPQLRFKGFTDPWEQRKFEYLLDENDGIRRGPFGSALKKECFVSQSDYVVYEQQNAIYNKYETRYNITKDKFEELKKFELKPEDFIMSGAGTIGRISRVPHGIDKGVFNQALIRFRIDNRITDSEYFLQFIRADFMQKKLTSTNPGSAITNLVPMSEVKKWGILVPQINEQSKIGIFFKQLDDTITLHQRKLAKLKELKQGYLQKMFPKNGSKFPQLRFAGFADDWEERKLSSGLREYTDRVIVEDDKEYYQISVRNNFGGITLRGSKMGNKIGRKRQAKINLTKYPQTLIFTRQTVEQGGIGWVDKYCDGAIVTENMPTISLDTSVFSKYFLTNLFQTRIFYKNAILDNVEGGSAQIAIHESKFLSSTLLFPNLDEQKKIGAFFKQLDDTITLHQRKLDLLKEQKKGFLQNMFV
ncbi:restriction endonuclease subunit S [Secundilactobacillus malefermentans]|uniref:restriction endonuclease subunit S n=1 Tax=Secundilactobacillus malefermentans TaxID=176292 RepID=UPI001CDC2E2C|nr:restriction endonuclease subunit S [Secundilactobacillus malefermentans]